MRIRQVAAVEPVNHRDELGIERGRATGELREAVVDESRGRLSP